MYKRQQLRTLPESFGSLTVGGGLYLEHNQLRTLPESFGSLTVDGYLSLHDNHLTTLPESFGSLTVGGGLELTANPLTDTFTPFTLGYRFPNVKGDVAVPDAARRECIIC